MLASLLLRLAGLALLLVALDTSRFLGHAFIFVLLLPRVLPGARSWLPIVFVVNVLIPSFYVGSDWYAPCNRFAQRFEPVLQAYFYRGTDYLPIWRR